MRPHVSATRPPRRWYLDGFGGPGGWIIFQEVDVRFASGEIVIPDLAGWRRTRAPAPTARPIDVTPDWVCEAVSPSNEAHDRVFKAELFARHRIVHYWIVDPSARTQHVLRLADSGSYVHEATWTDAATVRLAPFDAIELTIGRLFLGNPRSATAAAP